MGHQAHFLSQELLKLKLRVLKKGWECGIVVVTNIAIPGSPISEHLCGTNIETVVVLIGQSIA